MRFSAISAVLCGLAIVPGVVSQDGPESGGGGAADVDSRPKIYNVGGARWVCNRQGETSCFSTCLNGDNTTLKEEDGKTICQEIQVPSITDIPSNIPSSTQTQTQAPPSPTSTSSLAALGGSLTPLTGESKGNKVPQIAGGVVGGVLGLALIGGLIFFLKRRKRNREKPSAHHESAVIADKSRASSPVSHTSPIYGGAGAAVVPPPAAPARQFTDPELANPPPSQQPVVPIAPVHTPQQQQAAYSPGSPAELQSREVDVDGVSVNSFDMQRPVDEPAIPRLPVSRPTGSGL